MNRISSLYYQVENVVAQLMSQNPLGIRVATVNQDQGVFSTVPKVAA
jgi:hypothetical protein